MSYLHCPACGRAYNVAREPACPSCRVRPGAPPPDPTDDVITAAEQLARAIARATPAQLAAAESQLADRDARPALPAPDPVAARPSPLGVLRAIRSAIAPAPAPAHVALLATMTYAMFLFAKSQFTRFHHASMNFGRALR
jgi:hypothetical protein